MKKLEILLHDTLLYRVMYYIEDGLRGEIEVYQYDTSNHLQETNAWGDFYLTRQGSLHLNRAYDYNPHAGYTLAFMELQRVLFKIAIEEDVIIEANTSFARILANQLQVPGIHVKVIELSIMENLAYLYEQMMRYNCSPTITRDFLEKLALKTPVQEFDFSAIAIMDEIEDILIDTTLTENLKRDALERCLSDNIQIFADYERACKEANEDGTTFTG